MKSAQPDSITPSDWMVQNFETGTRVGFDPKLLEFGEI